MKIMNVFIFYKDFVCHKMWVSWYILKFASRLFVRLFIHDCTKLTPSESIGFFETIDQLSKITKASPTFYYLCD